LGILGLVSLRAGDTTGARAAFEVSRRLGWRDDPTNQFWLSDAFNHDRIDEAADHLDALLRQTPRYGQRNVLLSGFESDPKGRAALAARLARGPAWREVYFADAGDLSAGDVLMRGLVAERLARDPASRDCALVAPLIGALWRHRQFAQAREIYRLDCAAPGEALVPADGFFRRADPRKAPTELDWSFAAEGAIGVTLEPRAGWRGRAAIISNLAPVATAFASQPLALAPGVHRVTWRALDQAGAPAAGIDVAVSCRPDEHAWTAKQLADARGGRFTATATIAPDCPRQWLWLGVAPGANGVAVGEVVID
jgi:hypothetical protein